MSVTRIAFVQWPDNLTPTGSAWNDVQRQVSNAQPDILVTNEMPFGSWLANARSYDRDAATASVALHERAINALRELAVPVVISSRPIPYGERLVNEAFSLDAAGYHPIHHKQYLPEEPGFHEASWFDIDRSGFNLIQVGDIRIGVLLCTELFFNEHARAYGRAGADVLVVPRASSSTLHTWHAAGMLAAIVSGAYVVSSNRSGHAAGGPRFGGTGFAYSPSGELLAETNADRPLSIAEVDLDLTRAQKSEYPCYVPELD